MDGRARGGQHHVAQHAFRVLARSAHAAGRVLLAPGDGMRTEVDAQLPARTSTADESSHREEIGLAIEWQYGRVTPLPTTTTSSATPDDLR
ncbi:MAG: hypothetical protein QOH52_1762 [Pseudonocardiales bacterium]|jgi:hypothetical protein|nr:hypothetical protein [Pseudonocardiales bacterium]